MRLPVIQGLIDRRLLINYRANPEVVQRLLPQPFEPQLVSGQAIVGLCLIRLRQIRPRGLPKTIGIASENAAHRIAVRWRTGRHWNTGVYILRRDTNSRLNALAGGRVFPGVHRHCNFDVCESENLVRVAFETADRAACASVAGQATNDWPTNSVFASLADASAFFEQAPLGYSPDTRGRLQGLELRCESWHAQPLTIDELHSSFFDDPTRFPRGTITLDSGLIMHGIEHQWHTAAELECACIR